MNWRLLTNISDYVSLYFLQKGIKLPCFANNNDGLFKVHNLVHDFVSLWCMRAPSHQSTQKSCARIFNSFSPEVTFMFTSCFIDMNIRTEDCQEFQNILERSLCNYCRHLLHTYGKKCWTWNWTWFW